MCALYEVMKNKLKFRRISWISYIKGNSKRYQSFKDWLFHDGKKCKKFKSQNRQAYCFLLSVYGRAWIKKVKERANRLNDVDSDILHFNWIDLLEED